MIGDEVFSIFKEGNQIPCESKIVLSRAQAPKKKILLFIKDEPRLYRFGVVHLTEVSGIYLEFPLEIKFRIIYSGTLEISWSTGSARITYDTDNFDTQSWVRRHNLRI